MKRTYVISKGSMAGETLGEVELDVEVADVGERVAGGQYDGRSAVEVAALLGSSLPAVKRAFGLRMNPGINRETGTPGLSGIFSLRGTHAELGRIHVTKR